MIYIFKSIIHKTIIANLAVLLLFTLAAPNPGKLYAQEPQCTEQALRDRKVAIINCRGGNVCTTDTPIVNGSVDRFLQVLAFQESGGDPQAQAGTSSASGKYQYINSTWAARASLYGPSGAYARAKDAPEEIQDAVAYIEYTQKFRDLGNDLFKLAISHFLPAALTDESKLDIIPPGNVITPRQYADKLIQNIGKGIGAEIPLKYTAAPEFDVWLEKVGGAPPTINSGSTASATQSSCPSDGGVGDSALGNRIVGIAQQELAAGANEADGSYHKYTGGVSAAWCGYFVSWVLNEAGSPFEGGTQPAVAGILAYAQNKGIFHPRGESGFTPQPGDIAIYKEGLSPYPSHVNIVISYDATTNKFTSIGGNESNRVKQATISADLPALTGFMRIN